MLEITAELDGVEPGSSFALILRGKGDEHVRVVGDATVGTLRVDRTQSGPANFRPSFARDFHAPLRVVDGKVSLRMLLDTSSLEVFANGGETVLTSLLLPEEPWRTLSWTSTGTAPVVRSIRVWELKRAW